MKPNIDVVEDIDQVVLNNFDDIDDLMKQIDSHEVFVFNKDLDTYLQTDIDDFANTLDSVLCKKTIILDWSFEAPAGYFIDIFKVEDK